MKQVRWKNPAEHVSPVDQRLVLAETGSPLRIDPGTVTHTDHLWLAVYLPFLSVESLGYSHGSQPFAVYEQNQHGQQVFCANRPAQKSGVRTGISVSAARTLNPALQVLHRDPAAENRYLKRLAIQAGRWTPSITLLKDGLLLNIAASIRLFGGLESLVEQIRRWISNETLGSRVSLMPTPASAILCARVGKELCVTSPSRIQSAVRELPSYHLVPQVKSRRLLAQLGTHTIGDLLRLPREGLARRFGPELVDQLDRLLGQTPDPQDVFIPTLRFSKTIALNAEVTDTALLRPAIDYLLEKLNRYLLINHALAEQLQWIFAGEDGTCHHLPVHLAQPHREVSALGKLSNLALEQLQVTNPIVSVALRVNRFTERVPLSSDIFPTAATENQNGQSLIERLQNRLGKTSVYGIQIQADHRPEKAWHRCAPGQSGALLYDGERPLWLLRTPKPIRIVQGQVTLGSQKLVIRRQAERICSGWWDTEPVRRDYYRAETRSLQAWVFRDLDSGNWHLHGIF